MKILFDTKTNMALGIIIDPQPSDFYLEIKDESVLTKKIKSETNKKKHKVNEDNKPLYKDNVEVGEDQKERFDEVLYDKKPVEFATKTFNRRIIGEDKVERFEEIVITTPVEYQYLDPVMVNEIIEKDVSIKENPSIFSYEEVLEIKKKYINNSKLTDLVFYKENFNSDFIEKNSPTFKADISREKISIYANGECSFKEIILPVEIQKFEFYYEADEGIEFEISVDNLDFVKISSNFHSLDRITNTVYIRIKNPNEEVKNVYAVGILA